MARCWATDELATCCLVFITQARPEDVPSWLVEQLGSGSRAAQGRAARALAQLALGAPSTRRAIAAAGGIARLVRLQGSGNSSPELQRWAGEALESVCDGIHVNRRENAAAGIPPLAGMLDSSDAAMQCGAAEALSSLSDYMASGFQALASGSSPALVRLLSSSSAAVQCRVAGALASLSTDTPCRRLIAAAGGIPALVRLLGSSDRNVQWNVARALASQSSVFSRNHEATAAAGAIPALVWLLGRSNSDMQRWAAGHAAGSCGRHPAPGSNAGQQQYRAAALGGCGAGHALLSVHGSSGRHFSAGAPARRQRCSGAV